MAENVTMPSSLSEAAEWLAEIGKEQRASIEINVRLNKVVERLKQKALVKDAPHQERLALLVVGLYRYAEANRDVLLEDKKKSVTLPTGSFGWRMSPSAVSLKNVDSVIESLKTLGLDQFIRVKEEVNKEAMLDDEETAKTVNGVTISQHEDFYIKPSELGIEIATDVKKLNKKPRKKQEKKKGKKAPELVD